MLAFLLVLVVLAVVVWVITGPLRGERTEDGGQRTEIHHGAELEGVEAAKEAKYREIREAELDYRTGKLSDEDWKRIDATLRAEALEILKRSDELDGA
jgi:hypothetical protein